MCWILYWLALVAVYLLFSWAIQPDISSMARRKSKRQPACSCSRLAPRLLATWMILSVIILGFLAWFVVRPAIQDKAFRKTSCTVFKVEYRNEWQGCRCGRYCWSQFPCLKIVVKYRGEDNNHHQTAVAHEDETNLSTYPQCSFDVCSGVEYSNEEMVTKFAAKYGIEGASFPCFFNPANPSDVLIKEIFTDVVVLHAILWPLLSLLLSVFVSVFVYKKYYKKQTDQKTSNTSYKRFSDDPVSL